jgi:iron complex outermembrane receptor protein
MVNPNEQKMQEDESVRIATNFTEATHFGVFEGMLGLVYDDLLYNETSRTFSTRYISMLKYEYDFNDRLSLRAGADWNYIMAESGNYEEQLTEHRNDLFVSLRYEPFPFWTTNFNARQAFVTGFQAPFAPSWGNDFQAFSTTHQKLSFKTLVSRSYRVPTLNNRYWTPGGNPDLLPEKGVSLEGGVVYNYHSERFNTKMEATYYQMWVDDWIIWLPVGNGSVWSPENIRKVNSRGVEFIGKGSTKIGNLNLTLGGNYAYTRSVNQEGLNEFDRSVGKQLPYVPFHRATAYLQADYQQWHWQVNTNYTGYRYTSTDNEDYLEGFTLANTSVERKFHIGKSFASVSFQVRNLFDVSYQNLELRAMPGRSYHVSVRYYFSIHSQP